MLDPEEYLSTSLTTHHHHPQLAITACIAKAESEKYLWTIPPTMSTLDGDVSGTSPQALPVSGG